MAIDANKEKDIKDFCLALYILYILAILSQIFYITLLPGLALLTVTYTLTLFKKRAPEIKDTIFSNHLRWMLRTLYIGSGVYFPIAILSTAIAIIIFTNITQISDAFLSGSEQMLLSAIDKYLREENFTINLISYVTMSPVIIWFMRRYYLGIKALTKTQEVKKVTSWL